jgi:AraC-like DNA-binding protein
MTSATTSTRVEISTDHVPPAERFDFWREACCEPLGLTPEREDDAPFTARVSRVAAGPLQHVHYHEVSACHVRRKPRDIARHPRHSCSIYREAGQGSAVWHGLQEITTAPGDFIIARLDLPFETRPLSTYAHEVWLVPQQALAPFMPASRLPMMHHITAANPVGKLLSAYLDGLRDGIANMMPETLDRVIDNLCRLVGIGCGTEAREQPEAVQEARLAGAKQYIRRHLCDPHLCPARVATALGISLRTLHLAFEQTDTSVARHILQERLEACRTTLLNDRSRPVTDIAFAWGFNSLSGFYRAFRSAFGTAPGDLRAAAGNLSQA